MGGIGSGVQGSHWWRPTAKTTAEESWIISSSDWQKAGCFRNGDGTGPAKAPGGIAGMVVYRLREDGIQLMHGPNSGYLVPIDGIPAYLGGEAIYFRCPMARCGRRCRKLYLPPGQALFGCCDCHKLTWQSRRENKKNLAALRYLAQIIPDDPDLAELVKEWNR